MAKEKQEKNSDSDASSLSEAPAAHKDSIRSFIATLASFSGDLQYWGDRPKLLADIPTGATPEERMLKCTRWFIATLYSSYGYRSTNAGMEKKPYNPILGEQFYAQWSNQEIGDTVLQAEQIFGFHIENKKAKIILQGHCGQKSRFAMPAGVDISQTGHAILTLTEHNETYLITLPSLQVRGIITGRPYLELAHSTHIISSAGIHASIDYSGKGYFSGQRNGFKASLKRIDGDTIYVAKGLWSGTSTYSDGKKGSEGLPFYDVNETAPVPPEVKPHEEMSPIESRKLWAGVTAAINNKDYSTASKEKSKIEEAQRTLAKIRKEKGETQADALKLFMLVDEKADSAGQSFAVLKEKLVEIAGPKAIKEDDDKPHWRLRA
ncbi:Oxysterol binding protein [Entomortierella chlamydospora]|uniref:Oxysterol binding protein n=1 Tax=Entomortierella chlamydospora TaxID=101097 RepID=A0A9P6MSV4_9FUNG|nr:Oxysterol binding protein [Entomortierella chlamydospora]